MEEIPQIPQDRLDWIRKVSQIQQIPVETLTMMYQTYMISPLKKKYTTEEDWLVYCDSCLGTFVQEYNRARKSDKR